MVEVARAAKVAKEAVKVVVVVKVAVKVPKVSLAVAAKARAREAKEAKAKAKSSDRSILTCHISKQTLFSIRYEFFSFLLQVEQQFCHKAGFVFLCPSLWKCTE